MADEERQDQSRSTPDFLPHEGLRQGGPPAPREGGRAVERRQPAEMVPYAQPPRVVGIRPAFVVALLVAVILLAGTVVVLVITRPTAVETGAPAAGRSETSTPSSTTTKPPATRKTTTVPSTTGSGQDTTQAGSQAAPSWSGQLGGDGLSIASVPPTSTDLHNDIALGLMGNDETEPDTLSLENDTFGVRLAPEQSVSTASDCVGLIAHDRSGGRLQVRLGERVCFQNRSGDVGLLTVKERNPEGLLFALRIDLQVWRHST